MDEKPPVCRCGTGYYCHKHKRYEIEDSKLNVLGKRKFSTKSKRRLPKRSNT